MLLDSVGWNFLIKYAKNIYKNKVNFPIKIFKLNIKLSHYFKA